MSASRLVQHLLELAALEHDALTASDPEAAQELRTRYDEAFLKLQQAVAHEPLTRRDQPALQRLVELHGANQQLTQQLRDETARTLSELGEMRRFAAYSPLGADHKPTPRYLDASA